MFGAILLFVFYAGTSVAVAVYANQLKGEIHAIEDDICQVSKQMVEKLKIMDIKTIRSRIVAMNFQWICIAAAPVIYAAFLYQNLSIEN